MIPEIKLTGRKEERRRERERKGGSGWKSIEVQTLIKQTFNPQNMGRFMAAAGADGFKNTHAWTYLPKSRCWVLLETHLPLLSVCQFNRVLAHLC